MDQTGNEKESRGVYTQKMNDGVARQYKVNFTYMIEILYVFYHLSSYWRVMVKNKKRNRGVNIHGKEIVE